jgi:hypothetical protein
MTEEVKLRIKWPDEGSPVAFANNATLNVDSRGMVYLSFWQVVPPVLVGEAGEVSEALKSLGSVPAHPVARLVMSQADAKSILQLLKRHLEQSDDSSSNA